MERRRVLLIVAAVIAALGTLLVFFYVRSADNRAAEEFDAVTVLKAVKQIEPGETVESAQAAGKIEKDEVGKGEVLPGALTDLASIQGQIARTAILPGEQIVQGKFSSTGEDSTTLTIPKDKLAMSVNLTDTGRVSGFVNPGNKVAIFVTFDPKSKDVSFTQLLLPRISVIAVGTTTLVQTTTTDESGAQTVEQLPRTLFTLAVTQEEAQKITFAAANGDVSFGLVTQDSKVEAAPRTTMKNLFD